MDFSKATQILQEYEGKAAPAMTVQVRHKGRIVYERAQGWLDPETKQRPVRMDTLFDLASVTKLFVTTAFMIMVEQGWHKLDDPVRKEIFEFNGLRPITAYEHPLEPGALVQPREKLAEMVDAGRVTFRHLLTHSSGLPAWRPLKDQPDAGAALRMALNTAFFYPTGTRVIYSDIGLILLGLAAERTIRWRLDELVREMVTQPLGLGHTRYLPVAGQPYDTTNIAPTEVCAWRKRRVVGEVHDENAARLGGIAGHAGLFSTAADLARFGQIYLERGRPLLSAKTVAEMTRLQAEEGTTRRGLGFALWCADPEASGNPFHPSAFGHTGFTGTSLWIDPERKLVVSLLTNRVYYGRDAGEILKLRVALHRAIVEEVDR
jgi:CubicO group peptidase (beta-lactamase class C family)